MACLVLSGNVLKLIVISFMGVFVQGYLNVTFFFLNVFDVLLVFARVVVLCFDLNVNSLKLIDFFVGVCVQGNINVMLMFCVLTYYIRLKLNDFHHNIS